MDNRGRPIQGAEVTVAFGHNSETPDGDLLTPSNFEMRKGGTLPLEVQVCAKTDRADLTFDPE
jgi:hypothetical protein